MKTFWNNGESWNKPVVESLAAELNGLAAISSTGPTIYVDTQPGSTDTARITAARTALGSGPGIMILSGKTYTLTTPIAPFIQGQSLTGVPGATRINFIGTGDCIRIQDPRAWTSNAAYLAGTCGPARAGRFTGFTIDGTGSGASSTGIHAGDVTGLVINDVTIDSFANTGGKGLWLDNRVSWTEQCKINVEVSNCKQHVVFGVNGGLGSFGYSDIHAMIIGSADQDGFVVTGGAQLLACEHINVFGGFDFGVSSNTGTVFVVEGGSRIRDSRLRVAVELGTTATGVGPKTMHITSDSFVRDCELELTYRPGGAVDFQTSTFNPVLLKGFGIVDVDDNLGRMVFDQASRALGLMTGARGYLDPGGELILGGGNWFLQQMTAGAQTVTITTDVTLDQPCEFDLFIKQPASGSTTLTWPGGFIWLSGAAPTLSTVNSAIDHIHVVMMDHTTFFATHVNSNNDAETLTGKTLIGPILTDPLINSIKGTNGLTAFDVFAPSSAANRLRIESVAAGGFPKIVALGTDTDVPIQIIPKGAGQLFWYQPGSSNHMVVVVDGDGTNINCNVQTKGTGRIQENSNTVGSWIAVPSTATSTGKQGQMAADSSFLYICTATNTWRRVAIAAW